MTYAIIAAGEGSRLQQEGIPGPKPMVSVNGEMLIERLIRVFLHNEATAIIIIVNEQSQTLINYLQTLDLPVPLQLVIKSTPSSFHSFYELLHGVTEIPEELCLATTDSVFNEDEFSQFIRDFLDNRHNDGLLAVTSYIDDETPLYVSFDAKRAVTTIGNSPAESDAFVSGGIYCLRKKALAMVAPAMLDKVNRMRNFQNRMLQQGLHLEAWPFSKILDIDHATDIVKAEEFLKETASIKNLQHVNG